MKKMIMTVLMMVLLVVGMTACGSSSTSESTDLESISVYPQSVELTAGDSSASKVVVTPESAGNQDIIWVSSNEKVATVDSKGNITAVGNGICTITAASSKKSNVYCDVSVSVKGNVVASSSAAAPAASTTTTTSSSNSYVASMPSVSAANVYPSYYLSDAEVAAMSADQIQFTINQIYAKNGYIFKKSELQQYFSAQPWYNGVTRDQGSVKMSAMDTANKNLLVKYRDQSGSQQSGLGTLWTYYYVQQNLTDSMVSGYSKYDCQLMINTIYAMNGYIFETDSLQQLFNTQSWYHGVQSDMSKISFSSRDKANLDILVKHR